MDYDAALSDLTARAEADPRVRALVLTGSAAEGRTDSLSDRDVQVFTTDIPALAGDGAWWVGLGDVLVVERLEDGEGNPTRLVYYADGKIDFTLLPAHSLAGRRYPHPFLVLLDKDGAAATATLTPVPAAPPAPAEYTSSVEWAWAAAIMTARAIARGDVWHAKIRDGGLKAELLRMVEWAHLARHGLDHDTRHDATRMREWMDVDVRGRLGECWSSVGTVESTRALEHTITLFAELAAEVADHFDLPPFDHIGPAAEVRRLLEGSRNDD